MKKFFSYSGNKALNTLLPSIYTNKFNVFTSKNYSVQEQLHQTMEKYFQSTITGKGNIRFLASTNPDGINIYIDHNDYLHLSFHPQLNNIIVENEKQHKLTQKQGSDNMMSGVFLKQDSLQYQVSDILAKKILRKESVYLAQSGYLANFSLLKAIVIPSKTHVYIDSGAHESLWQGASHGILHQIKHNSLEDLKKNLDKYGSGIIVFDSLYSSRGSFADLVEICKLKEQYHCILVVDESHSIGLYGPHGRGLAALTNVTDSIDFVTGSLAKAYCVRAGFIAGRTKEVLYARELSSSAIFSSTLMSWDLQRLQRALEIIYHADKERERLLNISTIIGNAALELKFNVPQPILPSPILCLLGGPYEFTKKLQIYFENAGISPAIFIPPATPNNRSILRLTFHAGLSDEDVTRIIDTLKFIAQQRLEFPYTFKKPINKS